MTSSAFLGRAFAIELRGRGHRDEHGAAYQEIYRDVHSHWGSCFLSRNDNGRVRKLTAKAIEKEFEMLGPGDPKITKRRHPIVSIERDSTPKYYHEIPPYFHVLYCDLDNQDIHIFLWLPLEKEPLKQGMALLPLLKKWMLSFPLLFGTATPAFLIDFNVKNLARVQDEEIRKVRARYPEYQYFPGGAAGRRLDGFLNWGLINFVGPDLLARMGGEAALRSHLPKGFSCEAVGQSAIIVAASHKCDGPEGVLCAEDQAAYRRLADFLAPYRSTIYNTEFWPTEEWDRMKVDWNAMPD
jgi:hypothetical protein